MLRPDFHFKILERSFLSPLKVIQSFQVLKPQTSSTYCNSKQTDSSLFFLSTSGMSLPQDFRLLLLYCCCYSSILFSDIIAHFFFHSSLLTYHLLGKARSQQYIFNYNPSHISIQIFYFKFFTF